MPPRRKDVRFGASVRASNPSLGKIDAKVNYALSQLNTESKVKEFAFNPANTSAGSVTTLVSLQQGTSDTTRVGNTVRWKNLGFKMTMDNHATSDLGVRLMIVRDRNPQGAVATVSQIVNSVPAGAYKGFRNLDYTQRFDILWDKCYTMTSKSNSSVNLICIDKYIDLAERRIKKNKFQYQFKGKNINETNYGLGNAGSIADISENAFYFVAIGTDAVAQIDLGVNFRGRYLDN